ncbi:MAG: hypothetical protein HOW73_02495 [Polyangiaceae bacterium]|nr:hypothetical protein [Polyangiaceae bacterium]
MLIRRLHVGFIAFTLLAGCGDDSLDGGAGGSGGEAIGGAMSGGGGEGEGGTHQGPSQPHPCAAAIEEGQLLAPGESIDFAPEIELWMTMDISPSGAIYVLAYSGLWRKPTTSDTWEKLTEEVGFLPDHTFLATLVAYDDEHVYWNQGGTARVWTPEGVSDHFPDNQTGLLDILVINPDDVWAVGYNNTLLHDDGGEVTSVDLLSTIEPQPENAGLQLWKILDVDGTLAVLGVGDVDLGAPTLSVVGILGVLRDGQWSGEIFDTSPGYGFVDFGAATCGGNIAIGGDYALMGHVTLDNQFTYLGGGTLAQDLLIANTVETCGGTTFIGVGVPGGPSLLAVVGDDPAEIVSYDDQVTGTLSDGACYNGVLYYMDTDGQVPAIRRYDRAPGESRIRK